ncbi:MAG: COG4315 family predicted lipoprotein [Gaiellaceae bacterium]
MRLVIGVVAAVAAMAVAAASLASGSGNSSVPAPVVKQKDSRFGNILATRGHKALYYWNVEKRDFKVHCTGACARAWPPLIVKTRSAVPRRISGIKGTFGVIRRPDGRLQVTHNRLPIYTYAHERPNQVLCNNVDGWFVVRV